MSDTLWIVLALLFGVIVGWVTAHHTIATECQKLGAFYVGRTVFECKARSAEPTTGEGQ